MAVAVTVAHDALLKTLAPMVDDAGFDLVITSEEVTAQSKEAITGLVEGGVNALQVLLTLRAEGNLAAGLLAEAARVDDPALIRPSASASRRRRRRSRGVRGVAGVARERAVARGERSGDCARRGCGQSVRGSLAGAPGAGRDARLVQARREEMAVAVTVAHDALLKTLAPMVDDAGFDLVITSEEVTAQSKEAITGLVEGGVNALQALLTLRAEGNLAAGLLNEAAARRRSGA